MQHHKMQPVNRVAAVHDMKQSVQSARDDPPVATPNLILFIILSQPSLPSNPRFVCILLTQGG
jgi:hypothetical protein